MEEFVFLPVFFQVVYLGKKSPFTPDNPCSE